jgi:hypothetical protein
VLKRILSCSDCVEISKDTVREASSDEESWTALEGKC